jgi:hypothetical protein
MPRRWSLRTDKNQFLWPTLPDPRGHGQQPRSTDAAPLRIPPAPQFSPGQIDLRRILELAATYKADCRALESAIRSAFFADKAARRSEPSERETQQLRLARNVLTGMQNYGLYDLARCELSELGAALLTVTDGGTQVGLLAAHILRDLHGITLLRSVMRLQARSERVTKRSLADELAQSGFELARASTHHLTMAQWLREAGVLSGEHGWIVDGERVRNLTGLDLETIDEWSGLTQAQVRFLKTLRRMVDSLGGEVSFAAKRVIDQAEIEHGKVFRVDQLRSEVFLPLAAAGWLKLSETSGGRGGKSGTVTASTKLLGADLERLTGYVAGDLPADIRSKIDTPLEQIYTDLKSDIKHTKGIALELLAVRLASDLGLLPLRFRLRGTATGGAEVDLIAEGAHLHFSRWLFQCKNTGRVGLEDLAKEVGMATLLRAHVVVMATTGRFSSTVVSFAAELARAGPLQVVLIDRVVLARYRAGGAGAIAEFLHLTATDVMSMKRSQIDAAIEEASDGE